MARVRRRQFVGVAGEETGKEEAAAGWLPPPKALRSRTRSIDPGGEGVEGAPGERMRKGWGGEGMGTLPPMVGGMA